MIRLRLRSLLLVCSGALACEDPGAGGQVASWPPGVVAEVAGDRIERATLERIARARSVDVPTALDSVVADAVLAAAARERVGPASARAVERAVLARVMLQDLWAGARAKGPPTEEELRVATARRWWELDRPLLVRTTHAIVRTQPPVDDTAARRLAERIAAAVASATDAASFRRSVESVPPGDLEVKVEDLQPVAADGRAVDPALPPPPGSQVGTYAAEYAAAAHAIPSPGAKSPVVRSAFGYHVILAVEHIAEHRVPRAERVTLLQAEILERRAAAVREELVSGLRARHPVEIDRAADDLTGRIQVAR